MIIFIDDVSNTQTLKYSSLSTSQRMVLNGHVLQILLGIEKDSSVLFGLYFTNILSHLVSDTI